MKLRLEGPRGNRDGELGAGCLLITTPAAAGGRAGAALALAGGAPFLQPLEGGAAVFLNEHRLAAAQWLRDGDLLRIGDATLAVHAGKDVLVLRTESEFGLAAAPPAITPAPPPPAPVRRHRRLGAGYVLLALAAFAGALWFVFSARMLYVEIQPAPERMRFEGALPALRLRDGYLAVRGSYRLSAERQGYRQLVREVEVTDAINQRLVLALVELPGLLSVETPGVAGATVLADGEVKGRTPLADIELASGEHRITVRAEGYAEFSQAVRMEGQGRRQTITAALAAISAPVTAESSQPQSTGQRERAPADAKLRVESEPAGASITIDGRYAGTTPATVALSPGKEHRVTISKQGYVPASRSVRLERAEARDLKVSLSSDAGSVRLEVEPSDALLSIEGRALGPAHGKHSLPAAPTLLEIAREGYEPAKLWVTPKPGFEQTLAVKLRAAGAPAVRSHPERITAPDGTVMILVRPGAFTMGAPRRDPGQRANETLREVQLARPYYLSATEVTNAQFQKFRPRHQSGRFGSIALELAAHPVVNVRWEDAAAYCNWLNEAAQFPASYAAGQGGMAPLLPFRHGFRLPTEAEWEWAARRTGGAKETRFAWGDDLPPPPGSGNFADRSVAGELADTLKDYDDGYAGTAPVGRFAASPAGFFDLAGNAAEWVHDFYDIRMGAAPEKDPTGPVSGKLHVIRGSSWMQASLSALRWTYRDYGTEPRPDVGFRCARYAAEAP